MQFFLYLIPMTSQTESAWPVSACRRGPGDILEPDPGPYPRQNVKQGEAGDFERHALFTQVVKAASGFFLRDGRPAPAIR